MTRRFLVRDQALQDAQQLAAELDIAEPRTFLGERFLTAVVATFAFIEATPLLGTVVRPPNLRHALVSRPFDEYVVFYRTASQETSVIRIVHGRRLRSPTAWRTGLKKTSG